MTKELPEFESLEERKARFLSNIEKVKSQLGEEEAKVFFWEILATVMDNAESQKPPIEASDYEAHHLLVGSSINERVESKGFDWEGPTSIANTLEREMKAKGLS